MSFTPFGKPGQRRYGCWAGKPEGDREDLNCCAESVSGSLMSGMISKQCSRKRGHGHNGEYCKQHAKKYQTSS